MQKIILDTDFILNILKYRIRLNDELKRIINNNFEVYILDMTLEELKGKPNAKLALTYVKRFKILETDKDKPVDDLIQNYQNYTIATQDKALKEKLKKGGFSIITIRQNKFLVSDNVL